MIGKEDIRAALLKELNEQLLILEQAVKVASDATSHADAKSEGKYDTRAIESGYIANAQAERLQQLKQKIALTQKLQFKTFPKNTAIDVTALIEVVTEDPHKAQQLYFLLPHVGGLTLLINGVSIHVITTKSPVGVEFMGSQMGDTLEIGHLTYEIRRIN